MVGRGYGGSRRRPKAEPFTHVRGESEYNDATNGRIQADKVYPIFEVLVNSGVIYSYEYILADTAGDPTETNGRTQITDYQLNGAVAFELEDVIINLDKDGTGLLDVVYAAAPTAKLYFCLLFADASEFHYLPVGVNDATGKLSNVIEIDMADGQVAAATGVNIVGLATKANMIQSVYFGSYQGDEMSKVVGAFWSDTGVNTADIDIPFEFGLRRAKQDRR